MCLKLISEYIPFPKVHSCVTTHTMLFYHFYAAGNDCCDSVDFLGSQSPCDMGSPLKEKKLPLGMNLTTINHLIAEYGKRSDGLLNEVHGYVTNSKAVSVLQLIQGGLVLQCRT